jgi:hypothetical protein
MSTIQKSDGMNYAPQGKPRPVVGPGEFIFAAAHLEHGHIYGQSRKRVACGSPSSRLPIPMQILTMPTSLFRVTTTPSARFAP